MFFMIPYGVAVGCGVVSESVLVGATVTVGVTRLTRTIINCPTKITFSSSISLRSIISSTVLLNLVAISCRVSPGWIVYSISVPLAMSDGKGVGVGKACPGAGIRISVPGTIGQVPEGKLLIANNTSRSTLNVLARVQQSSPSLTV